MHTSSLFYLFDPFNDLKAWVYAERLADNVVYEIILYNQLVWQKETTVTKYFNRIYLAFKKIKICLYIRLNTIYENTVDFELCNIICSDFVICLGVSVECTTLPLTMVSVVSRSVYLVHLWLIMSILSAMGVRYNKTIIFFRIFIT